MFDDEALEEKSCFTNSASVRTFFQAGKQDCKKKNSIEK